jgi:hypothetical protein
MGFQYQQDTENNRQVRCNLHQQTDIVSQLRTRSKLAHFYM